MRIDYHTHHERCGHAIGKLREYVEQAIEMGIQQIGLSDHMPLIHLDPNQYLPEVAMSVKDLYNYVEECYNLKHEYREQIEIRVGLEADYIEGYERQIELLLGEFEWDYLIGSVHFIGERNDWDISDYRMIHRWQQTNTDLAYQDYYEKVAKAAATGLFDIIGHFDVIKRFGFRSTVDPLEWQMTALAEIKRADIALEMNTAGWQAKAAEQYPSETVLKVCNQLQIPITFGSDAHQPAHLLRDYERAIHILSAVGYQQLATFSARKRFMVSIN